MTPKFKPGQMVMIRGAIMQENNGKIVTLIKFVGRPPANLLAPGTLWLGNQWWEVDQPLQTTLSGKVYYAMQHLMVPLSDPDLSNDIAKEEHVSLKSRPAVPTNHHHA